ncbi:MAG: methyltransferase domain-containing protein [Caldilineaceae bacterium]
MNESDLYLLGYRQAEQERLERQALELARESSWLFDEIGIQPGSRVVEIGCGPRGCLDLLSARVGANGKVIGIERSAEQVERARKFVADNHLMNTEVLCADGHATGFPEASFDVATARLVLVNVPKPESLVKEMVRLVRPGGTVALHEADSTTQRYDPPLPAQTRLLQVLNAYAEMNDIDRSIGLKLPRMLRKAGLVEIHVNPFVHIYPPGHGRRTLLLEFIENARSGILGKNLIGKIELDELTATLKDHLDDPETLVLSSVFIQSWGRVPNR